MDNWKDRPKSHFAWKNLGRRVLPQAQPVVTKVNKNTGHVLKLYSEEQTVEDASINDDVGVAGWEKVFSGKKLR